MNKSLFILFLLLSTMSFAAEDVCCVLGGATGSGDVVQTFARVASSDDCRVGGMFQGKKICASVRDPENTYCSSESSYQDRCGKCGYFWSGKECLTVNPVDKAKKELKEEEEKKKAAEKKEGDKKDDGSTYDKPATVKPVQPSTSSIKPNDPDNPKVNNAIPEDDLLYNRKSKGIINN